MGNCSLPQPITTTACTLPRGLSRVQRQGELRVIQFLVASKNSPIKARTNLKQELLIPLFVLHLRKRRPGFRNLRCIRAFEKYILCFVINHILRRMNGQCQHFTNIPSGGIFPPSSGLLVWNLMYTITSDLEIQLFVTAIYRVLFN